MPSVCVCPVVPQQLICKKKPSKQAIKHIPAPRCFQILWIIHRIQNEKTLLLAPAIHYANEIALLAAVSAFILIFKEKERVKEDRKKIYIYIW